MEMLRDQHQIVVRRLSRVRSFYRIAVRRVAEAPTAENFKLASDLRWLERRLDRERCATGSGLAPGAIEATVAEATVRRLVPLGRPCPSED